MIEIHQKYEPQINGVLTPEQQAKVEGHDSSEIMEKHKGGMSGSGAAATGPPVGHESRPKDGSEQRRAARRVALLFWHEEQNDHWCAA